MDAPKRTAGGPGISKETKFPPSQCLPLPPPFPPPGLLDKPKNQRRTLRRAPKQRAATEQRASSERTERRPRPRPELRGGLWRCCCCCSLPLGPLAPGCAAFLQVSELPEKSHDTNIQKTTYVFILDYYHCSVRGRFAGRPAGSPSPSSPSFSSASSSSGSASSSSGSPSAAASPPNASHSDRRRE